MAIGAFFIVALVTIIWGLTSNAQEKPSGALLETLSAGEKSLEQLKATRDEAEASTGLPDPFKKSTLTYLDQAIRFREQANRVKKDAESYAQTIQRAPKRIKEIETELKRSTPPSDSEAALKEVQALDVEGLENKIRQEEASLIEAKANLTKLTDQIAKEENAPQQLREGINKAKEGLKEVQIKLDAAPPPNEPATVTESQRTS